MTAQQQHQTFEGLAEAGIDPALLRVVLNAHKRDRLPRMDMLWSYFRNELEPAHTTYSGSWTGASGSATAAFAGGPGREGARRYRVAQEAGLPARITGTSLGTPFDQGPRREAVIENDIGWRIQAMVDFMFGRPVRIESTASTERLRGTIERAIDAIWEASGGIGLLQDAALLGHVHGWVDLILRLDEQALVRNAGKATSALSGGDPNTLADMIRIEAIEPRRGIPIINDGDYRSIDAYAIAVERELNRVVNAERPGRVSRLFGRKNTETETVRQRGEVIEVLGRGERLTYHDGELVERTRSALLPDVVPIAHIQNLSQPFRYEGVGEVEQLIPLQDELNTRLSDRASRVTMQSFRMWLAKGLEGFAESPVGPGQVWSTDNPEASIESFGGDAASPSETEHIGEIREAMDKISGVPPVAGGVVRARIGNLSSGNALRVTLLGLLSKTARKRVTYGRGLIEISRLALEALDRAGVLRTRPEDRGLTVRWPDPLPLSEEERAETAEARAHAGINTESVLEELGVGPDGPGIE